MTAVSKKISPDPIGEQKDFREWARNQALEEILSYEDHAIFLQDIADRLMDSTRFANRGKPVERAYTIAGIRKDLELSVKQVFRSFGSPIDEDGGDPDAYVAVPANGEYGRAYYRRNEAVTFLEWQACLHHEEARRRRASLKIKWIKAKMSELHHLKAA